MSVLDWCGNCKSQMYLGIAYLAIYIGVLIYVVVKNRNIFKTMQRVIFLLFICIFICMIVSVYYTSKKGTGLDDCFIEPISIGLMSEEEALIITIYSLLLFRMLNIYSMLQKQTVEYRKKHRRGSGAS